MVVAVVVVSARTWLIAIIDGHEPINSCRQQQE